MKRFLIAGGGTGGHLFPAIAVAEELASSYPDVKVTFVGTSKGLESRIIPLTMWDLILMDVPSFKGVGLFRKIRTILAMPGALFQGWKILRRVKPDIVISVGGYAAGPLTLVAALTRRKTVAMEQNSVPGITNRILGKFVKKVFVTFAESEKYFSKKKVVFSGNPVRKKIIESASHKPAKRHGLTLLVFGGSQGARTINEKMLESLSQLSEAKDDFHIIHQIGRLEDTERFNAVYKAKGFSAEVYHFIEDMGKIYSLADLVVCRAGATSIAELTVSGKPAILIPYPYAADNHQVSNAKELVDLGGAIMIEDKDLTGEILGSEIKNLLEDPLRLSAMGDAMKKFGKPNAAKEIVSECIKLIEK